MAWPPPTQDTSMSNSTPQLDTHPDSHVGLALAINDDIVPKINEVRVPINSYGILDVISPPFRHSANNYNMSNEYDIDLSPPAGAVSAVFNLAISAPSHAGFVRCWERGVAQPGSSVLDFAAGQTVSNLVAVRMDSAGFITIRPVRGGFQSGTCTLVIDIIGWTMSGV